MNITLAFRARWMQSPMGVASATDRHSGSPTRVSSRLCHTVARLDFVPSAGEQAKTAVRRGEIRLAASHRSALTLPAPASRFTWRAQVFRIMVAPDGHRLAKN